MAGSSGLFRVDLNSTEIYDAGISSTLMAAERTYLAWVRTIISIVGFGLALGRFFSPTTGIGTITAMGTVIAACFILGLVTNRYYSIVSDLTQQRFEEDTVTPLIVSVTIGSLLLVLIAGGVIAWVNARKESNLERKRAKEKGPLLADVAAQDEDNYEELGKLGWARKKLEQAALEARMQELADLYHRANSQQSLSSHAGWTGIVTAPKPARTNLSDIFQVNKGAVRRSSHLRKTSEPIRNPEPINISK